MKIANLPLFSPVLLPSSAPSRGGIALLLLGLSLLAGGCQESGPPLGADLSTPRSAALFYLKAIQRGDGSTARRVCSGTAEEKEWVDALATTVDGMRKFNDALYVKFGRY